MSAGFVLDKQDPNLSAKTWAPSSTSSAPTASPTSSTVPNSNTGVTQVPAASAGVGVSAAPAPSAAGGLSTGAAAGIGIGSTAAGLMVIGILVYFLMIRRRKRKAELEAVPAHKSEQDTDVYFSKPEMGGDDARHEMPEGPEHDDVPSELADRPKYHELDDGQSQARELEGDKVFD